MTKFFKVNCFWLHYKYPPPWITHAFNVCKEKEIDNIAYFWGCMRLQKEQADAFKSIK